MPSNWIGTTTNCAPLDKDLAKSPLTAAYPTHEAIADSSRGADYSPNRHSGSFHKQRSSKLPQTLILSWQGWRGIDKLGLIRVKAAREWGVRGVKLSGLCFIILTVY